MENKIVDKVIEFWFADASNSPENAFSRKPFWYDGGKIIDQKIRKTFLGEVRSARDGELSHWVNTARGALALIIILDQFTRNVFRNTPQAYSGDELALNIVKLFGIPSCSSAIILIGLADASNISSSLDTPL